MAGGLTEEEMIDVALDLQARGADYISLSDGAGYEESGHLVTDKDRAEHIPEHGRAFKKALKIPVIVASQHDPLKAEADVAAGCFDIQALGRQSLLRPPNTRTNWPRAGPTRSSAASGATPAWPAAWPA